MNLLRSAVVLLGLLGYPAELSAQAVPEPVLVNEGHKFALAACAPCHVVSRDQASIPILRHPGPAFAAIANRPTTSPDSLRAFLSSPHQNTGPSSKMPNPRLVDYQIDRLTSYILSLRKTR